MDQFIALRDRAEDNHFNMVSGVNSEGITFAGFFVVDGHGTHYQITTTEQDQTTMAVDHQVVTEFTAFASGARKMIKFFDSVKSELRTYSTSDRVARQATMVEIVTRSA